MKILVVDDHVLFREGLRLILSRLGAQERVLEAGNAEEGLSLAQSQAPVDLILLDLHLPGLAGPECVRKFRQSLPGCPLIMLSGTEDKQLVQQGIEAGAQDFIHKSSTPDEMLGVIRKALGRAVSPALRSPTLTPRQQEVLARLCAGNSNKQIARDLGLSDNTVRVHLHDIFRTLGVKTRTQAAMLAKDHGLV